MIDLIRKRFSVIDGVGLAVLAVGTGLWYIGAFSPMETRRAAVAGLQTTLAARSGELATLDEDWAKLKRDQATLAEHAKNAVQLSRLSTLNVRLGEIPAVAEVRGIVLDELAPGTTTLPAQSGAKYQRTPIRMSGSAQYEAVQGLLGDLHTAFPDTEVVRLAMAGQSDAPGSDIRFTIELVWYTLPDAARSAQPSQAAPSGASPRGTP